jgi:hypothetical protein
MGDPRRPARSLRPRPAPPVTQRPRRSRESRLAQWARMPRSTRRAPSTRSRARRPVARARRIPAVQPIRLLQAGAERCSARGSPTPGGAGGRLSFPKAGAGLRSSTPSETMDQRAAPPGRKRPAPSGCRRAASASARPVAGDAGRASKRRPSSTSSTGRGSGRAGPRRAGSALRGRAPAEGAA